MIIEKSCRGLSIEQYLDPDREFWGISWGKEEPTPIRIRAVDTTICKDGADLVQFPKYLHINHYLGWKGPSKLQSHTMFTIPSSRVYDNYEDAKKDSRIIKLSPHDVDLEEFQCCGNTGWIRSYWEAAFETAKIPYKALEHCVKLYCSDDPIDRIRDWFNLSDLDETILMDLRKALKDD